ncbi:MAG: hypothetical protein COA96_16930 [SAR86 cluster bacterium]|uniref:Uncharacterized protein n=1 Tax=SAR86 cluster bacterium TaxID=2030880 RepID=A0A2A5AG97_9GAMM|nr:MAG: hypothetical protein COA96_16930 [SAR86 cluster bacterium]
MGTTTGRKTALEDLGLINDANDMFVMTLEAMVTSVRLSKRHVEILRQSMIDEEAESLALIEEIVKLRECRQAFALAESDESSAEQVVNRLREELHDQIAAVIRVAGYEEAEDL